VVSNKRVIRCKWCGWSRPLWYRTKSGKTKNSQRALERHVAAAHPEEFERITGREAFDGAEILPSDLESGFFDDEIPELGVRHG
jgi:hypothetical protein